MPAITAVDCLEMDDDPEIDTVETPSIVRLAWLEEVWREMTLIDRMMVKHRLQLNAQIEKEQRNARTAIQRTTQTRSTDGLSKPFSRPDSWTLRRD